MAGGWMWMVVEIIHRRRPKEHLLGFLIVEGASIVWKSHSRRLPPLWYDTHWAGYLDDPDFLYGVHGGSGRDFEAYRFYEEDGMAMKKVDTGGETIKEEVTEHRGLMKQSPTFRKAVKDKAACPPGSRKSMGKR